MGEPMVGPDELAEGIDEDGLSESYRDVETRYAQIEAIAADEKWMVVIADYQDGYIETRIPFALLEQQGWVRPDHMQVAAPALFRELRHLVRLLEPLEQDGRLDVPGLATLNGGRLALDAARPDWRTDA
jgi:hypothetical protein